MANRIQKKVQGSTAEVVSRSEALRLYIQDGWTQEQIAAHFDVCQPTISKWIKEQRERYRNELIQNLEEHQTQELEKLAEIERAAWHGWNRSLRDAETVTVKTGGDDDSITTQTKGQAGDPRFLDQITKVRERRAKLLGLDAPTKHQVATVDMGDLQTIASVMTGSMERAGLSAKQIRAVVEFFSEGMKEVVK